MKKDILNYFLFWLIFNNRVMSLIVWFLLCMVKCLYTIIEKVFWTINILIWSQDSCRFCLNLKQFIRDSRISLRSQYCDRKLIRLSLMNCFRFKQKRQLSCDQIRILIVQNTFSIIVYKHFTIHSKNQTIRDITRLLKISQNRK